MKRPSKPANTNIVKTTIRVPRELWKRVLHRSIDDNMSSQAIVERALEEHLKRLESRQ